MENKSILRNPKIVILKTELLTSKEYFSTKISLTAKNHNNLNS